MKLQRLTDHQVATALGYRHRRDRVDYVVPADPPDLSNDARARAVEAVGARGNERMFDDQSIPPT